MASQHFPGSYDHVTPHVLEQAMRDVWEVLKAHDPYRDWDNDPVIKRQVALTVMALADTGVTSPQELLSRTLDCFDLKPPH